MTNKRIEELINKYSNNLELLFKVYKSCIYYISIMNIKDYEYCYSYGSYLNCACEYLYVYKAILDYYDYFNEEFVLEEIQEPYKSYIDNIEYEYKNKIFRNKRFIITDLDYSRYEDICNKTNDIIKNINNKKIKKL